MRVGPVITNPSPSAGTLTTGSLALSSYNALFTIGEETLPPETFALSARLAATAIFDPPG